jgi:hypothetical protein
MTNEGWKTQLMVLTIEPLLMSVLERSFQWRVEEVLVRAGLDANAAHHLVLGSAGLIF